MTNLLTLIDNYGDDTKCRDLLEHLRWPNGVDCLRCRSLSVSEIDIRAQYDCNDCRYRFSVTAGTIMHDSHLPLRKWFIAIYLMCESEKGISALQLKRTLGVAYKTAWYLAHRIRKAMANDPLDGPTLLGILEVEVDGTLTGSKTRGKGRAYKGNKAWVAGAIQRGGGIRLKRIPNVQRATLRSFIYETIRDKAEAIYTDELAAYLGIADQDTRHETVTHSIEEWAVGDIHTNTMEGVWSLFKVSIIGAFHKVSEKHLDRYVEELEWRYTNRDNDHIFVDTLRRIVKTNPMTYQRLVA